MHFANMRCQKSWLLHDDRPFLVHNSVVMSTNDPTIPESNPPIVKMEETEVAAVSVVSQETEPAATPSLATLSEKLKMVAESNKSKLAEIDQKKDNQVICGFA